MNTHTDTQLTPTNTPPHMYESTISDERGHLEEGRGGGEGNVRVWKEGRNVVITG